MKIKDMVRYTKKGKTTHYSPRRNRRSYPVEPKPVKKGGKR